MAMTTKVKLLAVLTAMGETEDKAKQLGLRQKAMALASQLVELNEPASAAEANRAPAECYELLLTVPYFSQRDNGESSGYTCNSSSCFMLAAYAKPSLIKGAEPRNEDYSYYLDVVSKHGDTTDHSAQTAALAELGVDSSFHYDFSIAKVRAEIDKHLPVACAILHKGNLADGDLPYGGHIVVVVGYGTDERGDYLLVHDPNGELDLVHGGYGISEHGRQLRYSCANFSRRFETDADGRHTPGANGWARTLAEPAQATPESLALA